MDNKKKEHCSGDTSSQGHGRSRSIPLALEAFSYIQAGHLPRTKDGKTIKSIAYSNRGLKSASISVYW